MMGKVLLLAVSLLVSSSENPCGEVPTKECENLLADIALHWEREYHKARADHIDTLKLCAQNPSTESTSGEDNAPIWVQIILPLAIGVLAGAGVTALVTGL